MQLPGDPDATRSPPPSETPGHACGVFGVYAPGQPVSHLAYLGLYALQHRGQESAGIAVSDGETITVVKDMGLVTRVFDEQRLAPLDGHLAIGHNRYSTTGSSTWRNAQPIYRSVGDAGFALGHNGNLTNTVELAEALGMLPGMLDERPLDLDSTTDSALVAELVAAEYGESRSDGRDLELALERVLPRLKGGFSFVLMDEAHLIGVRDRHGFWPLVLGRVEGGWVLASETAALDIVGAHFVREIEPGEMIVIDASGVREHRFADADPKLCLFEFVYFARPDTSLYGHSVHAARQRMGEELARQAPVDADMVMPVPESGVPAAQGYARQSGHPVRRRSGEEPLRRPHLHPAEPEAARRRRAHEAQPAAREHPRQAARRRRRLDRARHHDEAGHRDAARSRRGRGALPRVVAAVPLALLLRHGHRPPVRAARGRPVGGRDRRLPQRRLARVPGARSPRRTPPALRPTRSARPASRATTRCPVPELAVDSKLVLEAEVDLTSRRRGRGPARGSAADAGPTA